MMESLLGIFTTEQKVETLLSNPLIEGIFIFLFVTFIVAVFVHIILFNKLKKIRNYLNETNRLDIAPVSLFKEQFDRRQQTESVKVETFVQEKFSSWRVFHIPVVNLIKIIQMTVSVFILAGVLGTFIGLTFALSSIRIDEADLVEGVAGVLSGIDIAFYTSIAGMGFSLIMTVLIKMLNTELMLTDIMLMTESSLEGVEQNGVSQLIDVSKLINQSILGLQETNQYSLQKIESAFSGFQEYTTGLQQSAKDLSLFNEGLSDNLQEFQRLFQQMKAVTEGFGQGTTKLNKNFDQLFSYFKKMDGRNERMALAFENTYDKVKDASSAQIESLEQFGDSVLDIKQFTASIMEEQHSIQLVYEKIQQKSDDLVDRMQAHNKAFKQIFGDDLTGKLAGIMTHLSELSRGFDGMEDSFGKLPNALKVINQTQEEYKHLLSDRFTELKEFNRTFNQHLTAHSAESLTFEKHMQEAARTYEQVSVKNNHLIREMNGTITQMNQAYNQRDNQLEVSVGVLKDTLANYVASLEGNLGNKLDKVARSIADYLEVTNEGLRSEFKEIRRLSETALEGNSRMIHQTLQELSREFQSINQQRNSFDLQADQRNNTVGLKQNEY